MSEHENQPFFPIACEVEEGKKYYWCRCGLSQTPPFCDIKNCPQSVVYVAELTETVYFCQCKETKDAPFCDGSHARLLREYLQKKKVDQ